MTEERIAYSPAEAAALVGVSRSTIVRAYLANELRVVYLGRGQAKQKRPRIYRDDLIAWVKSAPSNVPVADTA